MIASHSGDGFRPVRVLELELEHPVPALRQDDAGTGQAYDRAMGIIRLHGELLGVVRFAVPAEGMPADRVAHEIWSQLGAAIQMHVNRDAQSADYVPGHEPPASAMILLHGISTAGARCIQERRERVDHAPFVTVAIPTRDRPDALMACLSTLFALDYPNVEILIVDNAPRSTATEELVASLTDTRVPVRYIREDRPGISYAKNRGFAEARGEIVAFTDDDVLVDPLWLSELVRCFAAGHAVACATGMIFPIEIETAPQLWIEQFGGFSKGATRRIFDMKQNRPHGVLYPYAAGMFGSGANMALHRPLMSRLWSVARWGGPFDPALGAGSPALGGEDLGICFDILTAGFAIAYEPSAIVRHGHRRDYEGLQRQVYGYGVGLTAFLTKTIADRPLSLLTLLWKLPFGLAYALRSQSGKNRKKRPDYPPALTRLELRGMVHGPTGYLQARRRARSLTHRTIDSLPLSEQSPTPTDPGLTSSDLTASAADLSSTATGLSLVPNGRGATPTNWQDTSEAASTAEAT